MAQPTGRRVQAVDKAIALLEHIRREGTVRVTDVAERFDMSPGGAHNYLATLQANGWLTREDERYALSSHLVIFGEHVRNRSVVYAAGWEEIDAIADETGENAHLVVEDDGTGITLYEQFGEESVGKQFFIQNREKGARDLHCSSSGKAILAHLPDDRVEEIVAERGLAEYTDNTITDPAALETELEGIRETGVAFNDEEQLTGIRAVSAPIVDPRTDDVLGAVGVGGLASRFEGTYYEETLPELVRNTANVIQVNIQTEDYTAPR
jgi:DNA-binding IclR family transcriptional regulator